MIPVILKKIPRFFKEQMQKRPAGMAELHNLTVALQESEGVTVGEALVTVRRIRERRVLVVVSAPLHIAIGPVHLVPEDDDEDNAE
jgi:hypothetical protein